MIGPELFGAIMLGIVACAARLAYILGNHRGRGEGISEGAARGYMQGRRDERIECEREKRRGGMR